MLFATLRATSTGEGMEGGYPSPVEVKLEVKLKESPLKEDFEVK